MSARSEASKEHNRLLSRDAKRRRKGTCRVCGKETGYYGGHGKPVSDRCVYCANQRTHCRNGHELTDGNLQVTGGVRRCLTCARAYQRAYAKRRRAEMTS